LVILDDFSHFCWTFPLRRKSDVHQTIVDFVAYVHTQFDRPVKCFQADNGTEFVNNATSTFLAARGTLLRLSCPYTSAQNGKAERILRTLNNSVHTLLLHASMPASYWAEALAAACYLLNRRPSSSIHSQIPYTCLFGTPPSYDHLRVFGCLCYPNLQATSAHKLAPRSAAYVFLGYPLTHKGSLSRLVHQTHHHFPPCHLRRVTLLVCRHLHTSTLIIP
jgi:transposase InsO family protein